MVSPEWLGDYAKRKWKQLVEQLPTLPEESADVLALLCQSWDDYLTALACIKKHGQTIDSNGRLFINPACNEKREAWKQITKLSKHFGLLPTVGATEEEELEI